MHFNVAKNIQDFLKLLQKFSNENFPLLYSTFSKLIERSIINLDHTPGTALYDHNKLDIIMVRSYYYPIKIARVVNAFLFTLVNVTCLEPFNVEKTV